MRKYIILFVLFSTFAACKKNYLDKYPLDGPSSSSFITNEKELILAINGCYASLTFHPSAHNCPMPVILDHVTDLGFDRNNGTLQEVGKGSHDSNNGLFVNIWSSSYSAIARCNFLLENIDKVKDVVNTQLFNRVKAEARFLRAYNYHYLVEMFGGVPLVTTTLKMTEAQVPRSSKEELVNFMMTELEEAATDLPTSYAATESGRATKGAALAIKARIALYNEKWELAADAAKRVMDLNAYELHADFGELFTYKGQTSKEIIFALQYLKGTKTHNIPSQFFSRMASGFSGLVPGQSLVDSYECTDGRSIDVSPLFDPAKPFANRDPRLGYTMALPGSVFLNFLFETHKDSVRTWDYNTTPARRVNNTDATNAFATFTGYCWRKYTDLTDRIERTTSELNVISVRYAEVLLIYAEAKIEANQIDNTVYSAINTVRQRPGVNMPAIANGKTREQLRSIVRKERKYELAGEGFRLFDIRRWKIADQLMNGIFYGRIPKGLLATAPKIDDNGTPDYSVVPNRGEMRVVETRIFKANRDYLWPIPNIEILTNTSLEQNPNY
ncbi:RagB/SusD family nutrient uptake outer membrane protein [Longitalea luteola]|uniref:RagB/SusD family nutrient uptake outer membrane protein n=1 Tax=Longitalea luteola TaxID=2812563 RepID=UPI001A965D70|nr:RagB/SusD family nutrient uptake outer membrane protein [Longitalea luteola]